MYTWSVPGLPNYTSIIYTSAIQDELLRLSGLSMIPYFLNIDISVVEITDKSTLRGSDCHISQSVLEHYLHYSSVSNDFSQA